MGNFLDGAQPVQNLLILSRLLFDVTQPSHTEWPTRPTGQVAPFFSVRICMRKEYRVRIYRATAPFFVQYTSSCALGLCWVLMRALLNDPNWILLHFLTRVLLRDDIQSGRIEPSSLIGFGQAFPVYMLGEGSAAVPHLVRNLCDSHVESMRLKAKVTRGQAGCGTKMGCAETAPVQPRNIRSIVNLKIWWKGYSKMPLSYAFMSFLFVPIFISKHF